MISCEVCHAWRPKEWEVWRYVDVSAFCAIHDRYTTAKETCEHASITGGKLNVTNNATTVNSKRSTVRSTESSSTGVSANVLGSNLDRPALYGHQQEDFERYKDSTELPIFWTMGLGKSALVLAIAAYKFKKGDIDALLIIAPNDLHLQWAKEQVPLWLDCPYDIQCLYGRGGAKKAYPFDDDPEMLQIVCVNIDTFSTQQKWRDVTEWANAKKTFIVLDEATTIKNYNSQRTQRILYEFNDVYRKGKTVIKSVIKSAARAVLTGTPVTNGPMDLWSIMEFLRHDFFGRNWYAFQNRYAMFTKIGVTDRVINVPLTEDTWKGIKGIMDYNEANAVFGVTQDTFNTIHAQDKYEGPYKNADELKALLDPIASFRQLEDCVDMPEQITTIRQLEMTDALRECYDSMVDEYIAEYEDHTMNALNKMTVLIRLQQISSGFIFDKEYSVEALVADPDVPIDDVNDRIRKLYGLTEDEDITPEDKIQWIGTSNPKLDMLYRDVDESEKPVIIITRFSAEAARIYNDLSSKYKCCLITGWKREGTVEEFKEGKYQVMVANTAVIARGFNLQNSHHMFFYSTTFSLENRLQAEGRIYRIGQKNNCMYTDYVYSDSIDEKIIAALKLKRNLLDFISGATIKELIT
jgi:SNF2 family DNA or RNA helicase